mgnify:CR=1 FL=1
MQISIEYIKENRELVVVTQHNSVNTKFNNFTTKWTESGELKSIRTEKVWSMVGNEHQFYTVEELTPSLKKIFDVHQKQVSLYIGKETHGFREAIVDVRKFYGINIPFKTLIKEVGKQSFEYLNRNKEVRLSKCGIVTEVTEEKEKLIEELKKKKKRWMKWLRSTMRS